MVGDGKIFPLILTLRFIETLLIKLYKAGPVGPVGPPSGPRGPV